MKKIIALLLVLSMCLSLFLGCGKQEQPATEAPATQAPETQTPTEPAVQEDTTDEDLETALEYLRVYYKDAPQKTPMDYTRIGSVRIGTTAYPITWTVELENSEVVKVVPGDGDTVAIDVNQELARASEEPFPYVLKATLTGTDGREVFATWDLVVPAGIDEEALAVIDEAYALPVGGTLEGTHTLTGVITSIDSMYSEQYKNITVTMAVPGREDFPIMCYRMKGEGADALAVGDTITVTGVLKNYNGTIEFDAGCVLEAVESGGGSAPTVPETAEEILAQAAALESGKSLPYVATLTGKITRVAYLYNGSYISVTMRVGGYSIYCYRLTGAGIENLNVNDVITVSGEISKYKGVIEFNRGTLISYEDHNTPDVLKNPLEIVDAAYNLPIGGSIPYDVKLTGVITKITSPYSSQYNNITVVMAVEGRESKPITCYRMKGDGIDKLKVGDTITVLGEIQNYKGTIEFNYPKMISYVPGESAPEMTPEEIVDAAYALADGESLKGTYSLTGAITKINTAYSEQYKNITVTIAVSGRESKPIMCHRMKGDGAETLAVGDVITVTGVLKNYKGTIEFDAGCTFVKVDSEPSTPSTPAEIVDAAYALGAGESLEGTYSLTGTISSIKTPYSEQYKNITVIIQVPGREDKPITCFRMKGDGADALAVGDVITVTGKLMNYNGTVEFDAGCTFVKSATEPSKPTTEAEIVAAAYALEAGETLADGPYTLTGAISSIDTPYSENYGNITVTIQVSGKAFMCYRMKGTGAADLKVGDVIAVTGNITNYNGTIEFTSGCTFVLVEEAPKEPTVEEIVAAAYALEAGETLENGPYTLAGAISSIDTPYSENYGNITVTIQVCGKAFMCFRMKGNGAADLEIGDVIAVTGNITNYNGTIEFASGCTFTLIEKAPEVDDKPLTDAEIVAAAYALEEGETLAGGPYTLSGAIYSIDTPYSEDYGNITVTILAAGQPMKCFRLSGGADLAVGDVIAVTGNITNYKGTVEFAAGCTFTLLEKAASSEETLALVPEKTDPVAEGSEEESTGE